MAHKPTPPNPSGFCQCGCGGLTSRAKANNVGRRMVLGEHVRYVKGHGGRRQPPSHGRIPYEPSVETIEADCSQIRAAWTVVERRKRFVSGECEPWTPPIVEATEAMSAALNRGPTASI